MPWSCRGHVFLRKVMIPSHTLDHRGDGISRCATLTRPTDKFPGLRSMRPIDRDAHELAAFHHLLQDLRLLCSPSRATLNILACTLANRKRGFGKPGFAKPADSENRKTLIRKPGIQDHGFGNRSFSKLERADSETADGTRGFLS